MTAQARGESPGPVSGGDDLFSIWRSRGVPLSDAVDAIEEASTQAGLPPTIHTSFAGTAQAYQDTLGNQPILIAAALATVYIVLGVLYESYIHPITILSTLPSAGIGALLALMLCKTDLSIIAMIGIVLLIGIVKNEHDPDDRFRARSGAQRAQEPSRRDL